MTERTESILSVHSEERISHANLLAGFAEAVPVPVVVLTPDMRIRCANTVFLRLLGIPIEHYLHGRFPRRWLMRPQDALPQLQELLHRTVQIESDPQPIHLSLRTADGREIPTEVHAHRLPGRQHHASGLIVMTFEPLSEDVAQQRKTQRELRGSEERFRIIFECAPDAYYLCDLKGRFVDGNQAAEKMVGCKRGELIGKSVLKLNLLPKSQIPKAASALIKNAIGKPTGPDEFTLNRRDGGQVAVEVSTYPVRIQGEVLVLGIARDITERKRAQEETLREKAFSDSVINSMPGVFYMFDEAGRYALWNRNLEKVTEYTAEEIPSIRPLKLFASADQDRIAREITKAFREGTAFAEAHLVSKSGRKTPYYFTGVRIEKDGKAYLIGMGIDITERHKAQVMLEQLNANLEASIHELERSNKELQDFAHITAHDLKAPLRGIATLADWLAQDYAEQIDDQGQANLNLLQGRVDRMTHLIDGILRYSEIGHGQACPELVDTQALLEEVIEQIAAPAHIEIRIEEKLPSVVAERTRLIQVFQNLISNAVKYMDKPQGKIRISVRDDDAFWQFRIADNGPGIEAIHFDRIFRMFQTVSDDDRDDSTGLGLAVAKKIVDLYRGRIWLESQVGQGSTFCFTLPKENQKSKCKMQN